MKLDAQKIAEGLVLAALVYLGSVVTSTHALVQQLAVKVGALEGASSQVSVQYEKLESRIRALEIAR